MKYVIATAQVTLGIPDDATLVEAFNGQPIRIKLADGREFSPMLVLEQDSMGSPDLIASDSDFEKEGMLIEDYRDLTGFEELT